MSTTFKNLKEKLSFVCSEGHSFETSSDGVIYTNKWCPYCAKNKVIDPLKDMNDHAISRGGKFISTEYVNGRSPLTFECADGHVWNTTYSSIKHRKSWCPKCHNKNRRKNLAGYLNKPKQTRQVVMI